MWDGLREVLPADLAVLAPDLPGHGGAAPLASYSFDALAAAIAAGLDRDRSYVVLGHSLGGVVGLALAGGGHGVAVDAVVGLGIKVAWSAEDLERAAALADRPPRVFSTYEEAAERHLAVSGLRGLVPPDARAVRTGLRQEGDGWRLALDPRAFGVGAPDMPALVAAAPAVRLARGAHDPMVTDEDLLRLVPEPIRLAGPGHSAHVEDPAATVGLLKGYLSVM